jgi:hypothetical protein
MVRVNANGLVIVGDGLLVIALFSISNPAIVIDYSGVRANADSLVIVSDGLLVVALVIISPPAIVIGFGVACLLSSPCIA